ncbi:MAG TPA: glycosyl hydrolase 108 family protein [Xanthobacteraceae bacterium]|jgi:lysozyme family protein|nr:glycosyl hydrolase 108 family protein [Xanthobacteraceae bacterium]
MSADSCAESIRRVLASEGGYVNHPSDPGGPTNFGITIGDYRRYMKPDASAADVRVMKVEEATSIYREKYWRAMRCDDLPAGVDYCAFDYAVNSGTGRVPKVLQRVLGVGVTGRFDEATLAAAQKRDPRTLIEAICDERLRFLQGLKTWPVFGKGWGKRVGEVRVAALALADKADGRAPRRNAPATRAPGKGIVPVNDAARRSTSGGALASGGIAAQQSAAGGADWLVIGIIVLAAVAIAAGAWAFWRWHQRRRQEAAA